jgi:hypothetical protein
MSDLTDKKPTEAHKAFADYIKSTHGTKISAATVALVQRAYPEYLKSPAVVEARQAKSAARAEEAKRKAAEKQAKMQARLDRLENERAALLERLGVTGAEAETEPETEHIDLSETPEDVDLTPYAGLEDDTMPGWDERADASETADSEDDEDY